MIPEGNELEDALEFTYTSSLVQKVGLLEPNARNFGIRGGRE